MTAAAPISVMTALKAATRESHRRLERRLAITDRFATRHGYAAHLAALWGFQVAAEDAWAPVLAAALPDFAQRRKAALLEADLRSLGAWPVPGRADVPAMTDQASALGAFYVLEGATLGGRYLLPLAERAVGVTSWRGAAYLSSYGPRVDAMWESFGATVEARCASPSDTALAIAAAEATFLSLENWLVSACPSPLPPARGRSTH